MAEEVIIEQPRIEESYFSCKSLSSRSITDYFDLESTPLATGSFGSVYAGTPTELAKSEIGSDLPETVAIKQINLSVLRTKTDYKKTKNFIKSEIAILKTLKSDYSSKYYGCFETLVEPYTLYLVMELVEGQDLFEYMAGDRVWKRGQPPLPYLSREDKVSIISKIAKGITELHSVGLAHRDLKPENIMYNHHTKAIKIIDYGLSCLQTETHFSSSKIGACKGAVGSPPYVDPKTINNPYMTHKDLQLSDWWSFGQIVYAMFEEIDPSQRGWRSYRPVRRVPVMYHEILSQLLNDRIKPIERPKPDDIRSVFILEE